MKCFAQRIMITLAVVVLPTVLLGATELTANSIVVSQKAGVSAESLIALINDPANTIAITSEDLATLRNAGVPESVIAAIQARGVAAPAPAAAAVVPDDPRLVDIVRLVKSGISEPVIADQVQRSGQTYKLSVNDLLYLKQNDVQDSIISVLLATQKRTPTPEEKMKEAASKEVTFDGLLLRGGTWFFHRDRPGRLVLDGETLSWIDGSDPKQNFDFKIPGLEKIWYTCQSQTPENFCYQINFQVVKGPRYGFEDVNRASGSNATVRSIMETLRERFPRAPFGSPENQ